MQVKREFPQYMRTGSKNFTAFSTSIGESLVFFGRIELLVFVRTLHLKAGSITPLLHHSVNNTVRTGTNLGVVCAPNKGKNYIVGMRV